ncbi:MAG: phosphatase PAP2 family protein [Candidatus Gracilibacteria bacterium]|jgi:undecaprenyl-diphosphatase
MQFGLAQNQNQATQNKSEKSHIFTSKEKLFSALFFIFLFFALFWDDEILRFLGSVRVYPLDAFLLFLTDFGLLYSILVLLVYLLVKKYYHELALMLLTAASALEISYLMKVMFQTPRPFAAAVVATIPLTQASGFSMPSLHTAFCFSLWPYMRLIFPNRTMRFLGYAVIILIAFSRLYLGVHYASDLIAGGLIGYSIAKVWLYLEQKYHVLDWFIFHVKDKFELRRQIAHIVTGCSIVFLFKLQLLNADMLVVILILGGVASLIARKYRVPMLDHLLRYLERPRDLEIFPGKGSFFLVLGSLLAIMFFKREIALAAITIMAVGDAITTIVGTYFGKIKNPLNPRKHLEGTALAIVVSTLAAFFFVDFKTAFIGSLVGMIFESLSGRYISEFLDDNLIITIVAGVAMALVS